MEKILLPKQFLRNIAQGLIGIPFQHCGRDSSKGLDCLGLVLEFYRRLGFSLSDPIGTYREEWWRDDPDLIGIHIGSYFDSIDYLSSGSVLTVRPIGVSIPAHLMVYLGDNIALNTDRKTGSHILRLSVIQRHICGIYQYRGLEVQ